MTPQQAEDAFSAAYDGQLDSEQQNAFATALAANATLAQQYAEFCETLDALKALDDDTGVAPTPDLLRGVQRRLRDKSGGRFYADKFAERSGWGARQLFISLLAFALLLAIIWGCYAALSGIQLPR
ncbi:MAG: hypothetical protein RL701_712 [Pseudomonadota bacterium]|jgi:anti-sigma factor RsiW